MALDPAEREGGYSAIHDSCFNAAKETGQSDQNAKEYAEKAVKFTRALVRIIETGGGSAGGKA